jgi:hypothetical protein
VNSQRLKISENKNTPSGKTCFVEEKKHIPTEIGNVNGIVLGPQNGLVRGGGNA